MFEQQRKNQQTLSRLEVELWDFLLYVDLNHDLFSRTEL